MNTDRIYEILWNDPWTSSHVLAVIPCNALKYAPVNSGGFIVNCNENSYLRGDVGHWIFLRIHGSGRRNDVNAVLEVFDALGLQSYNEEINEFMKRFRNCYINHQHISDSNCGFYALAYSYYSCRGLKTSTVLNILKEVGNVEEHCLALYGVKKA